MNTEIYYKTTRMDGTSVDSDVVTWEVGKVTYLPKDTEMQWLETTTIVTEYPGTFPCRLFRVEPIPWHNVIAPSEEHPERRGATAWRVVEELPATLVFGAWGEEIVALMDRISSLTFKEVTDLSASRAKTWGDTLDRVQRGKARDEIFICSESADMRVNWKTILFRVQLVDGWDAIESVVIDTLSGLHMRGLISSESYNNLTLPWRKVVGRIHPTDEEV